MTTCSAPPAWKLWAILSIGILSVSTAAIFIRLSFEFAEAQGLGFSLVIAATRLTFASLMLLPAWRGIRRAELQPKAFLYAIAAGIFLALHFAAWITSLSYTSIAASTSLVTTNPIWVALLSWLWFNEKPSWLTSLGIGVAIAGSLVVSLGDTSSIGQASNPALGNVLAIAGSWAVSLYFLLGREGQRCGLSIQHHIALTYSTAALVLLPLPLLTGTAYHGYPFAVYLCIFFMALFPQVIGHTSLNWVVRWISPTLVTLTILAEPLGSSLLGFIVFQENPGITVLIGAATILSGVAIAAVGSRSPSSPDVKS